jgi:hydroxypyruvate isomerase
MNGNTPTFDRRSALKAGAGMAAAGFAGLSAPVAAATAVAAEEKPAPAALKGNIKQSVCRWCFGKIKLEDLAAAAAKMGLKSIELLGIPEVQAVKSAGLTCAVLTGGHGVGIEKGLNRKEHHEAWEKRLREGIEFAAAEGVPNVICFSGNRAGMDDDTGLANCAEGLKRVLGFAEEKKVTVIMELLNSKVNHKDYMCDHTAWGVALAKKIGSPRFKLLYDIYHMQIMEGDVIATIKASHEWIAHYHTAGVPGRHELDDAQELNYPAICKAIVETGYTGFLGQEFIPKRDPLTSLAEAVRLCDV